MAKELFILVDAFADERLDCLSTQGVLDHLKFTDGLVAHSHLAMAGVVSSMNIFLLTAFLEEDGECLNSNWSFFAWQVGLLIYIASMAMAGWREGYDPSFTIIGDPLRNFLYSVRLAGGLLMFSASVDWLVGVTRCLQIQHQTTSDRSAVERQSSLVTPTTFVS